MFNPDDFIRFNDAKTGTSFTRPVLICKVREMKDKNGNAYVLITLQDGFSEIEAKKFKTSATEAEAMGIRPGAVLDATVEVQEFNKKPSYLISRIVPCADPAITIDDLVRTPPVPLETMYQEICDTLKSTAAENPAHTPLYELVLAIYEKYERQFKTSSAAVKMHHNMRGGLLYHTYRMIKCADAICGVYPALDRELLLCGTALHDIGKIWEYRTSVTGSAEYTENGVLFGHLYLGASLVKKFTDGKDYDPEKVRLLVHMILSHHGTREFGAVTLPSVPEAMVLCYVDNIDAKLYMFEEQTAALEPGKITESKVFALDTNVYRPKYDNTEDEE